MDTPQKPTTLEYAPVPPRLSVMRWLLRQWFWLILLLLFVALMLMFIFALPSFR